MIQCSAQALPMMLDCRIVQAQTWGHLCLMCRCVMFHSCLAADIMHLWQMADQSSSGLGLRLWDRCSVFECTIQRRT